MDRYILKASPEDQLPNQLLLLGDENQQLIDAYLPVSEIYLLKTADQTLGVCVVKSEGTAAEIMNIVIEPDFQGRGLGKALLRHVIGRARAQGLE